MTGNWDLVVSKNYYTSLTVMSLFLALNISRLEAALPAALCSQDLPLRAGSAGRQLEVLLGFGSLGYGGPFQRICRLADADLQTLLCSSVRSARASEREWPR